MPRIRLMLTKGEEVRYISHLDYVKAVERALRRSRLPLAYSEGFNPHPKLSFASALAVGVTSAAEYIDAELTAEIDLREVQAKLPPSFGRGIELIRAAYVAKSSPALTAAINLAEYEAAVFLEQGVPLAKVQQSLEKFNGSENILFLKKTPKSTREIDIKNFLAYPIEIAAKNLSSEKCLILKLAVKITPAGSVKPADVFAVLVRDYEFPSAEAAVLIKRTGLYIEKNGQKILPMDFVY